ERATITVRIGQSQSNPAPLVPDNLEPSATTPSPVRITGLMRSDQGKSGWIALRNFSPDPLRLEGFSIHGGIIPNHFSVLPPTQLMPREERRFTLASLRLTLADEGRIILRDPGGSSLAQLDWSDSLEKTVHRPPVLTHRTIDVHVARLLSGDTFTVTLTDIDDPDIHPSVLHRWRRQELSEAPGIVLRLLGVEAPPVYDENGGISETGIKALNFVSDLIYNKKIELEFDTKIWDSRERLLAYARIPGTQDTLQHRMLREGIAIVDRSVSHPLRDAFLALEDDARRSGKGMWALSPRDLSLGIDRVSVH
ncbi:thermonuclease family protein, partial [Candidatus Peribacteria bacterium]|nr:thermonuclease family protein [Candidatus Peribacteria bacterium]